MLWPQRHPYVGCMAANKPHEEIQADDSAQDHRFVETARELGADESLKAMEQAFNRVVGKPKPKKEPEMASRPKRR